MTIEQSLDINWLPFERGQQAFSVEVINVPPLLILLSRSKREGEIRNRLSLQAFVLNY